MNNDILGQIAGEFDQIDSDINEANELITFLTEVGVNVTEQKKKLRDTQNQRDRWREGLKKRGKL